MINIKLARYADDNGNLTVVGDAEILRRRLTPEMEFDFAGVESVSELARESIQHHLSHPTGPRLSLKEEVQSLSAKIDSLTGEVDRLSRLIQSAQSAHA